MCYKQSSPESGLIKLSNYKLGGLRCLSFFFLFFLSFFFSVVGTIHYFSSGYEEDVGGSVVAPGGKLIKLKGVLPYPIGVPKGEVPKGGVPTAAAAAAAPAAPMKPGGVPKGGVPKGGVPSG